MNRRHTTAALSLGLLLVATPVFADTTVSVDVPDHCTVVDTDSMSHAYSGGYLGICALQTAIDSGGIAGAQFSNAFPSLGLFVTSVGGVAADPNSQYWALYQNGTFASLGLSSLPVAAGDSIALELHDFSDTFLGTRFILNISSLVSSTPSPTSAPSGGGKYTPPPARAFDLQAAINYLSSKQRADGSFGSSLLTDWAAIAVGAEGDLANPVVREKLRAYLASMSLQDPSATDLERHSMALEALGIDPYAPSTSLGASETSINYIDLLLRDFDGAQMGERALINDDIFAIFPLSHAGYEQDDPTMRALLDTIVQAQQADGSWASSVDLTAAAIQALTPFHGYPGVASALSKAEAYLRGRQIGTGGFNETSFSTSWALQAIAALNQKPSDWNIFDITPLGDLGNKQQGDGGEEPMSASDDTRIWASSYAIPAALARPWHTILKDFVRPAAASASTSVAVILPTPTKSETPIATKISVAAPVTTSSPAPSPEVRVAASTSQSTSSAQVAAVAQTKPHSRSDVWVWFLGLLLIAGTVVALKRM